MEITAVDAATGTEAVVSIQEEDTVSDLRKAAAAALSLPSSAYIDLCVPADGTALLGELYSDTDGATAVAGLEEGCRTSAVFSGALCAAAVAAGEVDFGDLPRWAQADRGCAAAGIAHNPHNLRHASEQLRADTGIVLSAAFSDITSLEHASPEVKGDRRVILHLALGTGSPDALRYAPAALQGDPSVVLLTAGMRHALPSLRDDPAFAAAALRRTPSEFEFLSERLRGDKDLALLALPSCGQLFGCASPALRGDREVFLCSRGWCLAKLHLAGPAIRQDRECLMSVLEDDHTCFYQVPEGIRGDPDFFREALLRNGSLLQYADVPTRDDRDLVLKLASTHGLAFHHATPRLRGDREVVHTALQSGGHLVAASPSLRSDRGMVLHALRCGDATALERCGAEGDRAFVEEAISACPASLSYASAHLRADRGLLMHALRCAALPGCPPQTGCLLHKASEELCADRDVVLLAVALHRANLLHASPLLQRDRGVVSAAVAQGPSALLLAAAELREDRDFALSCCATQGGALRYVAPRFRQDREVVCAAAGSDGASLCCAWPAFWEDRGVALLAVTSEGGRGRAEAVEVISQRHLRDPGFVLDAVRRDPMAIEITSGDEAMRDNREIALAAVSGGGGAAALRLASPRLRGDPEVVLAAVGRCPAALEAVHPEALRDSSAFVFPVVYACPEALAYVGSALQADREFMLAVASACPPALQHMPAVWRGDAGVVLAAVGSRRSGGTHPLRWASPGLLRDPVFLLRAAWRSPRWAAPGVGCGAQSSSSSACGVVAGMSGAAAVAAVAWWWVGGRGR